MSSAEEDIVEGVDCSPCCRNEKFKSVLVTLILGQILSLCLCGTGVTSQFLSSTYKVDTPTAQTFISYFLLCLVYGTLLAYRPDTSTTNGLITVFRYSWWKYAILAFIDVQANYLMVRAYQYTDLASIQVLDCFTIPVVLLLSFFFLYVRYRLVHVIGVAICLIGIGCLVWGDIINGKNEGATNKLLGDLCCLTGAALYGVSNVAEEKLVKQYSRIEYLGMVGLFGSVISGIQLAIIERDKLSLVPWHRYEVICLYLAFAVFMFAFYSLVTIVLQRTSAAMYNLSILTADFYTLLAGLFIFNYAFHYLYFVSFACVLIGSVIYSMRPTRLRSAGYDPAAGVASPPPPPLVIEYGSANNAIPSSASCRDAADRRFVNGPTLNATATNGEEEEDVVIKMCKLHGPVLTRARSPHSPSVDRATQKMPVV